MHHRYRVDSIRLTHAWKFVHKATVPVLASTKKSLTVLTRPCTMLRPAERERERKGHMSNEGIRDCGDTDTK